MRTYCLLLLCLALSSYVSIAETATRANSTQTLQAAKEKIKPAVTRIPQRSLDLSVPFKAEYKITTNPSKSNLFASENKTQPVELDGRLLMTQEQEVEKRKTLDGAGIVIKLRP